MGMCVCARKREGRSVGAFKGGQVKEPSAEQAGKRKAERQSGRANSAMRKFKCCMLLLRLWAVFHREESGKLQFLA